MRFSNILLFVGWLFLHPAAQKVYAQHYRAESTNPAQPFLCRLVLQRDSTFCITYQTQDKGFLLEHRGCSVRIKDSLYCLESSEPWEVRRSMAPGPATWHVPILRPGYTARWKRIAQGKYAPNLWKPLHNLDDLPNKQEKILLRIESPSSKRHLELELKKGEQLSVEPRLPQELEWVIKPLYAQTSGEGLPHGGGLILFQHVPNQRVHATSRKKTGRKPKRTIIKEKHTATQSRVKQAPAPPRR